MVSKNIVFTAPNVAELLEVEVSAPKEDEVQVRLDTSSISSGELHEYYDPECGAPIMNPGFQNWNLLSLNIKEWLDGNNVVTEF